MTDKILDDKLKANLATFTQDLSKVWSTDRTVRRALGGSSYERKSNQRLTEQLANASSVEELVKISVEAKVNQGYADVIDYFKSMYYFRYVVTPVRNSKGKGSLLDLTREMLDVVETIGFESILPEILEKGLFEGAVSVFLERQGDQLVTYILPMEYSKPFMRSNYGTETVIFNLDYFQEIIDDFVSDQESDIFRDTPKDKKQKQKQEEERAEITQAILAYFPEFLKNAYYEYAKLDANAMPDRSAEEGPRLINLPPESAAIVPFSPSMAPPKINVTAAEENYKEVLEVQQNKHKAGLEKIFTHKIPIGEDGDLLISVTEAKAIQDSMEQYIGNNADVTVVTTIGDTELYDVQKESSERNRIVSDAYNTQLEAASINPELFRANTDYALGVSLNRDAAFVWGILQKIMNVYNLAVNELFEFGESRCYIKLLPITFYNEEERLIEYRRNAEYGIGKLDAIIATGEKQITLLDKLLLEQEMNLDDMLTPLQSSHTRSSKDQGIEKEKVEIDSDDNTNPNDKEAEEVTNE